MSGVDEAGRGCLAGPVVVARVTWQIEAVERLAWFGSLADSKTLEPSTREALYANIVEAALEIRTGVVGVPVIDYLNILKATLHGFELVSPPFHPQIPLLIDGNQKPASLPWAATMVKGDGRVSAIAAAGIVAKVTRDRMMQALHHRFPGYAFQQHKGYATAGHQKSLQSLGPCPLHRKSYGPVALVSPQGSDQDGRLLAFPTEDAKLHHHWRFFTDHYHRFSLTACREAMNLFQRRGMLVLPNPKDPVHPCTLLDSAAGVLRC